jgi:serine/threonine protein phosphatase PrpC
VAIILEEDVKWFGVYDGHGGDKCSQFLKEHLHKAFFINKRWREDPKQALYDAFRYVEAQWMKAGDNSGSCCLVVLIYEDTCYVANLGDSRAILAS